VSDFITIFSTRSPVEADVVRGLLEANGVMPIVSSATSRSLRTSFSSQRYGSTIRSPKCCSTTSPRRVFG